MPQFVTDFVRGSRRWDGRWHMKARAWLMGCMLVCSPPRGKIGVIGFLGLRVPKKYKEKTGGVETRKQAHVEISKVLALIGRHTSS